MLPSAIFVNGLIHKVFTVFDDKKTVWDHRKIQVRLCYGCG